tara:strand:- start:18 stop:557 length:540 start_codon:yes stop_codon:yes gene_type:complete
MANKAGRGTFAITVEPADLKNLIQTLNLMDKETQQEVRDAAYPLSQRLAGQLLMFSQSAPSPQTKLVAQTIDAKRDRLIRVDIGGSKKVGRKYGGEQSKSGKGKKVRQSAAPAGALLWGTEFGSHKGVDSLGRPYTDRFKAPSNKRGYWITPAVDYYTPIVSAEYVQIVKAIIRRVGLE